GPPVRAIVRGTAGELLGCYLFHGMRGGTGRVLQVLAGEKNAGVVLDCLLHAARAAGLAALRGRTTPRFMPALLERNCVFLNRGTTIVHARDSGVRAAAFGDALILGLAGESWTRLIGDDFA